MKFSVQLPTDRVDPVHEFTDSAAIVEMAQAIEKAGFDACYVTEHPFPSERWLARGGHHALDPFVSLAVAASATRRLKLHTHVLVLAYRNPFLVAKSIASLDAISGGRVIVGTGAGYLEEEFDALGVPYAERNARFDDALEAIKSAWSGEPVERVGPGYSASDNTMRPRPVQRPHPPLWVGCNSPRAIRRAVDFGDGWSPFPLPAGAEARARTAAISSLDDLVSGIERLHDYAARRGRTDRLDINFVPFGLAMNTKSLPPDDELRAQFAALEEAGVTWLSVGMPTASRGLYLESVARFGETFLSVKDESAVSSSV